ncbi:hypothetical protein H0H92_006630 [Tricholoma furcatifolium]|nr:hypothetical protein H0H92_006630 [Tricholoma furcatifolium]
MQQADTGPLETNNGLLQEGIRRRPAVAVETGEKNESRSLDENGKKPAEEPVEKTKMFRWKTPSILQWIPANCTQSKLKPVIRCAIAAWVALVLFVIPRVQKFFGQVASVLAPPSDPFPSVLEREVLIMLFTTVTWAWCCLGIKLADLLRTNRDFNVTLVQAIHGEYVEAAPTVMLGVFIFLGSTFILFLRAHKGPGPYLFPCIFACICLDICLTTAVLFPFPYYLIGKAVVVPLAFHSVIALLTSIFIFPTTISAHFTNALSNVLNPLISALEEHRDILAMGTRDPDFPNAAGAISATVSRADGALTPLAAAARLLRSDLIYGRFSPLDFAAFHDLSRRAAVRANGMGVYFSLVDPTRPRFPLTPAPSAPVSPALSRQPSTVDLHEAAAGKKNRMTPTTSRLPSPTHSRQGSNVNLAKHLHHSLSHYHPGRHRHENAVGVFESQRYMNLEATRLNDPFTEQYTAQMVENLHECCNDLLDGCRNGLTAVKDWLGGVRAGRLQFLFKTRQVKEAWAKQLADHQKLRDEFSASIERFRTEGRHRVLEPYRSSFDPKQEAYPDHDHDPPAHRHLFQAYVYQYHLIQFAWITLEMIDEMIRLEKERTTQRLWTPVQSLFRWDNWQIADNSQHVGDEDPDTIQGLGPSSNEDLGMPLRRDPDALPPRNAFEAMLGYIYYSLTGLSGGNIVFAIKAGFLTVLLALPSFLPSSTYFAYNNRFVWGLIMGQVSLSRFQGDTTFALFARVFATFLGGVGGMIMCVMSFLPPTTTIRRYQRNVMATTSGEIGAIYCAIVSFANSKNTEDIDEITLSLGAIRSKLLRSKVLRANAAYELSLRGPWPAERYHNLWDIQLQIAYYLSHLMSVFKHLEPAWARALLRRTRLSDTDFQGDILAVMTMVSTSLRSGSALPQISPCPLLDRFMSTFHGLDIIHKESEEDYGLPRTLTLETLQDEQYLFFCVGVSTAYGIVTRLDRLMVAAKEIVGEQYHIYGIGGVTRPYPQGTEFGAGSGATPGVHFRPPQEV